MHDTSKRLYIYIGVFGQIKGYYETMKNGSLHIHTFLWLNNSPHPNTLIQTLHDNESFPKK
jgi:hypothetical protein